MGFELGCKCTGQKRSHEHDGKGYGIFASIGDQRQPGFCQKIIEQDDTQKGGQHAAGISAGKSGGQKHTQQINHDDIGIRKAKPQKQPSDDRSGCQNPDSQKQFPGGWKRRANGEKWFPGIAFIDLRIRNDVNVHLRRKRNELFCQRRFAPEMPSLHAAAPNYDFGHIGEPRIFCNLRWYIFDFLKKAGQKVWQILPVGPTSYGDSPYQSFSTYAADFLWNESICYEKMGNYDTAIEKLMSYLEQYPADKDAKKELAFLYSR